MEKITNETKVLAEKLFLILDEWLEHNVASKDENGEYWGWDTNVGDLKEAKQELISKIVELLKVA